MSAEVMTIDCSVQIDVNGTRISFRRSAKHFYVLNMAQGDQVMSLTVTGVQLAALGYALANAAQFPRTGDV